MTMKIFRSLSRRGLALFLVLTMCLTLLPATAMAEEWDEMIHTCNANGWTCTEATVCGKPVHTHGDGTCEYAECQLAEHDHTEADCVQNEDGSWACGLEEHSHAGDVPVCTLEEHTHEEGVCWFEATHTAPSENVVRFLSAVEAIPAEITTADEAVIAAAQAAFIVLSPEEQSINAVADAYNTLAAAEIALADAKAADAAMAQESSIPEGAIVIDPAMLVAYNNGMEAPLAVADLFTLAAGVYQGAALPEEYFPGYLYLTGEGVEKSFGFMETAFAEEQEYVGLTVNTITYQSAPVSAYFLPEEAVAQDELLEEMGNKDVSTLASGTSSRVYIYLKLEGTLPASWTPYLNGTNQWVTVGYIDIVGLDSAKNKTNVVDKVVQKNYIEFPVALERALTALATDGMSSSGITFYDGNGNSEPYKGGPDPSRLLNDITFANVEWHHKDGFHEAGLFTASGAEGYVKWNKSENCYFERTGLGDLGKNMIDSAVWHLNGVLKIESVMNYEVTQDLPSTGELYADSACTQPLSTRPTLPLSFAGMRNTSYADKANTAETHVNYPAKDTAYYAKSTADGYTQYAGMMYKFSGWTYPHENKIFPNDQGTYTTKGSWTETPVYTVIYTDGVADKEVFADQANPGLVADAPTPAFKGANSSTTPTRTGYTFLGWQSSVEKDPVDSTKQKVYGPTATLPAVTGNVTYTALWDLDVPGVPTVTKGADKTAVTKGDVVTYTVTITPNPDGAAVTGFKIEDAKLDTGKETSVSIAGETNVTGSWNAETKTYTLTNPASTMNAITVTYTYTVDGTSDVTKGTIEPNVGKDVVSNTAKVTVYHGSTPNPEPTDPKPNEPTNEIPYKEATVDVTKVVSGIVDKDSNDVMSDRAKIETTGEGEQQKTTTYYVQPDDVITWTITVTNNDQQVAAKNVNLEDVFTVGDTSAALTSGPVLANSDSFASGESINSFTIPAGGSKTFTATYKVVEADKGKTIVNGAKVNGGEPETPPTPVIVERKAVNLEKTVSGMTGTTADGKTNAKVGDTLTYKVKITNTGNVPLSGLKIADTFKVGEATVKADKISITSSNAAKIEDENFTGFTLNSELAAGASVEVTYTYTVEAADAGKTLTNAVVPGDTDVTTDPKKPDDKETDPDTPTSTETKVDKLTIRGISKTMSGTTPVTIAANATEVTLHYAITVTGDVGAKFTVTDEGAALDSEQQQNTVTAVAGQDSTWAGILTEKTDTNGTKTGEAVIYVTKAFPVKDGKVVTETGSNAIATSIENAATVHPGDNSVLPKEENGDEQTELTDTSVAYQVVYIHEGTVPANTPAAPATEIVPKGDKVTVKAKTNPVSGYSFDGWRQGNATTATEDNTQITVNANVEFKGAFKELTAIYNYAVFSDTSSGGTVVLGTAQTGTETSVSETVGQVTGNVYENGAPKSPQVAIQGATALPAEGWEFEGWYKVGANNALTKIEDATASYKPGKNGSLYDGGNYVVKFKATEYTVKYDLAGGKLGTAVTVADKSAKWTDKDLLPSGTPTKDGYTFKGWFLLNKSVSPNAAKGETVTNATAYNTLAAQTTKDEKDSKEITLVAVWEENAVPIKFAVGRGLGSVKLDGAEGDGVQETEIQYVGNSSGVCYELTNGAFVKKADTFSGATATPVVGYRFVGWYVDQTCSGKQVGDKAAYKPEKEPVVNLYVGRTYYARFDPIDYTVKYNLNGGNAPADAATELYADKTGVKWASTENWLNIATPVREGYEFLGWYASQDAANAAKNNNRENELTGTKTYADLAVQDTVMSVTLYAGWNEVAPSFPKKPDGTPAGGVVKSSDKTDKVVQPGDQITYTVTITPEKTTATEVKGMVKSFTIKDAKLTNATNIQLAGKTVTTDYSVSGTGDTREFTLANATQEQLTVTYEYTVVKADAEPAAPTANEKQYIKNTATVTLKSETKSSDPETDTEKVEYQEPAVTITKAITSIKRGETIYTKADNNLPAKVKPGDEITWTITVTNTKDVIAKNVKVTDTFTITADDDDKTVISGQSVTWKDNKDPTADAGIEVPVATTETPNVTYEATYTVPDVTSVPNIAGATIGNIACEKDKTPEDNQKTEITVEKRDYSITKMRTNTTAPVKPGSEVSYKITVTNTGNVNLTDLVISDVLSYTDTGATGTPNGTVTFIDTDNVMWDVTAKTFTVTKVEPGEAKKVEITYTYTVSDADAGHTIKNTAEVTADKVKEENPPEVTVQGAYKVEYYFDNVLADENKENGKYKSKTGNAAVGTRGCSHKWDCDKIRG